MLEKQKLYFGDSEAGLNLALLEHPITQPQTHLNKILLANKAVEHQPPDCTVCQGFFLLFL